MGSYTGIQVGIQAYRHTCAGNSACGGKQLWRTFACAPHCSAMSVIQQHPSSTGCAVVAQEPPLSTRRTLPLLALPRYKYTSIQVYRYTGIPLLVLLPAGCCCRLLAAAACCLLTAACWLFAAGCWRLLLLPGCWLLTAAACWLLAAGCRLLLLWAAAAVCCCCCCCCCL